MIVLSLPPDAVAGDATGINNSGVVIGHAVIGSGTDVIMRPLRWSRDAVLEELALPDGTTEGDAAAINDAGDIVGNASHGYYYVAEVRAVIWRQGAVPAVIGGCGQECMSMVVRLATALVAINTFYPAGPRASYTITPGKYYDLGTLHGNSTPPLPASTTMVTWSVSASEPKIKAATAVPSGYSTISTDTVRLPRAKT